MSAAALQRTLAGIAKRGKPIDLEVIQRHYRKAIASYTKEPNALLFLADQVTPYLGATQAFLELLASPHVDPLLIESMFTTRIVGIVSSEHFHQAIVTLRLKRPDVYEIVCWRFAELAKYFYEDEDALAPITSETLH